MLVAPVIGRAVTCRTCGKRKAPRGRSVPVGLDLCDHECPGWHRAPHPGDLWPNETAADFGFPCEGPSGDDVLEVLRMTGRCATGAERDGGRRWHLVPPGTVRALCGARPGRHSGWSPHPGVTATCPRCVRAAARRADSEPT